MGLHSWGSRHIDGLTVLDVQDGAPTWLAVDAGGSARVVIQTTYVWPLCVAWASFSMMAELGGSPSKISIPETQVEAVRLLMI